MEVQLGARPASTPPFGEGSKILNSVRASNLAQSPPTRHSNCSEWLWLHARTILVALENYSGWLGESNQNNSELATYASLTYASSTYASSFSLFCLPPPKYNAASAIADKIWLYCTGRNLMIFNKDHDTAEEADREGSCSQAYGFATIAMYSWWQPSEIGCAYRI